MIISDIDMASADVLAPILLTSIQRLGQLGREGALALAALVDDGDAHFDEGATWIADIVAGDLPV